MATTVKERLIKEASTERVRVAALADLEAGRLPAFAGQEALASEALRRGDAEMIRRLLRAGMDPNSGPDESSRWLCEAGATSSSAVFKALIEGGANASLADAMGETPLMACCRMSFERVNLRVPAAFNGRWPLEMEARLGEGASANFEVKLEELARAGVDPNSKSQGGVRVSLALDSPLGTRFDRPDAVFRALAKMGFDLNAPTPSEKGGSLLHAAAIMGAQSKALLLIELGADPLKLDALGRRPLEAARETGWDNVAEALRVPTERAELERGLSSARRSSPKAL